MYHGCKEGLTWVARGSPRFEQHSVHGEAQNCKHCRTDTRSQPEGRALQVSLAHVSVKQREAGPRHEYRQKK